MAGITKADVAAIVAEALASALGAAQPAPRAVQAPARPLVANVTKITFPWEGEPISDVDAWARDVFTHVGEWNLANPTYTSLPKGATERVQHSRIRDDGQPFLSVFANRPISGEEPYTLYELAVESFGDAVPPAVRVGTEGGKTYPFQAWITNEVPWLNFSQKNLSYYAATPTSNGKAIRIAGKSRFAR